MASEKNFENRVKAFLKEQGCYFIKYWGGGEFTKAGVPDILVCCNGKFLGVEVKAQTGRPKMLQVQNLKKINEAGGYGVLLYPNHFDLFKNLILCIKAEDENASYNYDIFNNLLTWWERKLNG
ncbi:MAG: VRR-NUC domain-containing protein [Eubacteriales bacterium]|nr:VRR-NUC domain-containing protein [Eubacteriales bacterium]